MTEHWALQFETQDILCRNQADFHRADLCTCWFWTTKQIHLDPWSTQIWYHRILNSFLSVPEDKPDSIRPNVCWFTVEAPHYAEAMDSPKIRGRRQPKAKQKNESEANGRAFVKNCYFLASLPVTLSLLFKQLICIFHEGKMKFVAPLPHASNQLL